MRSGVQAACAADLARLAIYGSTPAAAAAAALAAAALNFPASIYTQQQVAATAALLQLKRPVLELAAIEQSSSSSSSSSSTVSSALPAAGWLRTAERVKQAELQAAADAAVADAAAAAAAAGAAELISSTASWLWQKREVVSKQVPNIPPFCRCGRLCKGIQQPPACCLCC
jgi:hypothetical protein